MLMVMSIMENGLTTKLTDTVFIHTPIMLDIADYGKMTNSMAKARKLGQMELSMKANTSKEKSTEKELSSLVTDPATMETSIITTFTAMGFTSGQMVKIMKEPGTKTKCTVKAKSSGKMAVNMMVITNMIRNTVTESSSGMMAENTKVTGNMGSNMEKVYI